MSVYLLSTTELYQLVKLPVLVEHFMEHRQEDKGITLWDFLCMHYAHGIVKDADYEKDMKLPFKTHDYSVGQTITPFTPNNLSAEISKPISKIHTGFPIYQENGILPSFLSNIWQPPKFC
ncbi:MAG: hypothetical protein KGO92_11090 [Bacteroidota bacterium]|nr:hypothetical protein [Bacteroidota bacterium]